jgi:hypothetical protein
VLRGAPWCCRFPRPAWWGCRIVSAWNGCVELCPAAGPTRCHPSGDQRDPLGTAGLSWGAGWGESRREDELNGPDGEGSPPRGAAGPPAGTRELDNGLAGFFGEGADRNRTDDGGFADLCLTTWLRRRGQQTYPCLWPSAIRSAGPRLRHRAPDRGPGARVKFRCRGPQSPTEPRCRRPETLPASHRGRGAGDGVTPAGPRPILRSCPRSPPPAAASP